MATDFSMKQYVDPTQIAALAQQQQAKQAQLDQQGYQDKMQAVQQIAQSVSQMVSNSVEASKQRQKREMVSNLADSMASRYAPDQMAPQMGPGLPTMAPAGPTSADNAYQQGEAALPPVSTPDYAGQNAIKASVMSDPNAWTKQLANQLIQSPSEKAQTAMNNQKANLELANAQKINGPLTPASQGLIQQFHQKIGTPAPDLTGMTEQQGQTYLGNVAKLLDKPSANNPGELTDADRKRLAPLARAVVEGRATPSAMVSARGAEKEKLSQIAAEIDPNFDLSLAPQRSKMRNDYTPAGTSGKSLTSLNTVIGHLDTLDSKLAALDNADVTKYNSLANWASKNAGKPEVAGFNAAKTLVDGELGKIVQGSGVVTNEERKQFANDLNSSSSPAQAKEVVATWMELMKSRTEAIKSNWSQTMGNVTPPVPFINDKSKKILIKHGYNPDTMEKADPSVASGGKFVALDGGFSYRVK